MMLGLLLAIQINSAINASFAKLPDSCLPNARAKVSALRAAGFAATILIVHQHGAPVNHAIVHLRFDGATYYLNNTSNILATEWNSLYDILVVQP